MSATSRSFVTVWMLLTSLALSASAQEPQWSLSFGSLSYDEAYDVATDPSGNILVTGAFTDSTDFGGGVVIGAGLRDIYVAKYDPNGNHVWSQGFGNNNSQHGESIAADGSRNVLVAGDFLGSVNFGGGTLTSVGGWDMFLAKLDPSGIHIWSQRFGSTVSSNADGARAVVVDESNNVYLAGYFSGTVSLGGASLVSAGSWDVFVAKFDSTGTHQWSQRFGGASLDYATALALDSSANIVLAGRFLSSSVDFGGGPLSGNQIFLAKYDSAGTHLWSQAFTANAVNGVATDPSGNVVATGRFTNVDFGGGPMLGPDDAYVVKFDSGGNHDWSIGFGSSHDLEWGEDVAVDDAGNIIVTGEFYDSMSVGGITLASEGSNDVFVAAFDSNGNASWANTVGGPQVPCCTGTHERAAGVEVDGSGGVILTGWFEDTMDFGLGTLTPNGERDIYLAKYLDVVTTVGQPNRLPIHELHPNVPNPFNPTTTIAFTLGQAEHVTVQVYDVAGRLVATLVDGSPGPGRHHEVWNGRDDDGSRVSSGVYFYRMRTATFEQTRRMVLLK